MCRRLAKICTGGDELLEREYEVSSSEWALSCGEDGVEVCTSGSGGCSMMPTPSLLAEPSRPIAIGMLGGFHLSCCC